MLHLIIRPQVTPQLVIGVILVANSTFQYHKVPYMPAAPEPTMPSPRRNHASGLCGSVSDSRSSTGSISLVSTTSGGRRGVRVTSPA